MQRKAFCHIGIADAEILLARGDTLIFDVREASAFRKGHIPGARNVSVIDLGAIVEWTPQTTPILIYCHRGYASREYAQIFSDFRFQEVYSLDGGYKAWTGRPVLLSA
jgi:thiosulfate/3-mercaptopyruvate sulfurtransferase